MLTPQSKQLQYGSGAGKLWQRFIEAATDEWPVAVRYPAARKTDTLQHYLL